MANYITVSETEFEKLVKEATGFDMAIDAGPSGETVTVFGSPMESRFEVDLWHILPKVGLDAGYWDYAVKNAIRKALKSVRKDIRREVDAEMESLHG